MSGVTRASKGRMGAELTVDAKRSGGMRTAVNPGLNAYACPCEDVTDPRWVSLRV